uniref:Uncharacterized protein n=1 Tax=Rhizophora mucronata TaxID=61149 RepID=A0A2P2N364_RHIMU
MLSCTPNSASSGTFPVNSSMRRRPNP